jgi:hypothetical protein
MNIGTRAMAVGSCELRRSMDVGSSLSVAVDVVAVALCGSTSSEAQTATMMPTSS